MRHAFVEGQLNPSLIYTAIKHRDYFLQTFNLDKPDVKARIVEMARQFDQIKTIADRYGAGVIILSIPFGIYVSHSIYGTWQQHGFLLDPQMLSSDSADRAIGEASRMAGLPFFSITEQFRRNENAHLFYKYDGHFNI